MCVSKPVTKTFRKIFNVPISDFNTLFASHMNSGMQHMQKILKNVDCILELHDARIPISGRNPQFRKMLTAIKPHILLLNKCDLIDDTYKDTIVKYLTERQNIQNVLFIKSNEPKQNISKIIPLARSLIDSSDRYNRSEESSYAVMVIGVPNVGKSSLINALRERYTNLNPRATKVGSMAGITKSVLEKIKVYENPPIYLYDTPGILWPRIDNNDTAMKLALCGTMQDRLVGYELMCDYLLFYLNKSQNFTYLDPSGLLEPTDDVRELLYSTAGVLKKTIRIKDLEKGYVVRPDLEGAARYLVSLFRKGFFGPCMLDASIFDDMYWPEKSR